MFLITTRLKLSCSVHYDLVQVSGVIALPRADSDGVCTTPQVKFNGYGENHTSASSVRLVYAYRGAAIDTDGRVPPPRVSYIMAFSHFWITRGIT